MELTEKPEEGTIPLSECEEGYLYRIDCRNLSLGVFNSKAGFIGIRDKWGSKFLFTEYHWDTGPPFGTVCPKEKLEKLPDDIELTESLGMRDMKTKRPMLFVKEKGDASPAHLRGKGKWVFTDTGEDCGEDTDPRYWRNEALFDWLKKQEEKL